MTRALLLLLLLLTFGPSEAWAQTIWERAREVSHPSARQLVQSLERVLSGSGTPRDQFAVRVGLVSFSRGEVQDPLAVILLSRLRRQLGLAVAREGQKRIERALSKELSSTYRAWAHEELFYLIHQSGDRSRASRELNLALDVAWQAETRGRLHILRGYALVFDGAFDHAERDFLLARELVPRGPWEVRALLGLGLLSMSRGERVAMARYLEAAERANRRRAAVSGADDFKELLLSPEEHELLSALTLLGKALVRSQESGEEDAVLLYQELCRGRSAQMAPKEEENTTVRLAEVQLREICAARSSAAGRDEHDLDPLIAPLGALKLRAHDGLGCEDRVNRDLCGARIFERF